MLTPDYFYGKSDKLIEMYQDLEDWIISNNLGFGIKGGCLDYHANMGSD